MHSIEIILLIPQLLYTQAVTDYFPIGVFGCKNLAQAESCYFNMAHFWWDDQDSVNSRLTHAERLGMKIILARAKTPEVPDVTGISGGQRAVYQAESQSFAHNLGEKIHDPAASNDTAWAACSRRSAWLQHNLWTDEQYLFQPINFIYYAYFNLKTNNNLKAIPVCSLLVRREVEEKTIVEASRLLTGRDFSHAGEYETFIVTFDLDPGQGDKIDYAIKYLGTGDSLYCDRVDIMDVVAHKLRNGAFDNNIRSIVEYYGKYPALYRYYLWDEPTRDQLWASGKVHDLLTTNQKTPAGGLQALYLMDVMHMYLDSVKTQELLVDFYPLYGSTNYYGRTPVDSGSLFQKRLTNMCDFLSAARYQVKSHPGTKLWFMPQTFGHAITNTAYRWDKIWGSTLNHEDEGWWREPTPRELRCMIWLALAHGAKGVVYYRYHSLKEHFDLSEYDGYRDDHWIVGLTDPSSGFKRSAWYTVRELNKELTNIGSTLASLFSDTIFSSNIVPPANCFIKEVSDTLVQIGTFHDKTHDYFIVVNRKCLPRDRINVIMRINADEPIHLYDCYTKEAIPYRSMYAKKLYDFAVNLEPGQGRLFRITPWRR